VGNRNDAVETRFEGEEGVAVLCEGRHTTCLDALELGMLLLFCRLCETTDWGRAPIYKCTRCKLAIGNGRKEAVKSEDWKHLLKIYRHLLDARVREGGGGRSGTHSWHRCQTLDVITRMDGLSTVKH
jgi:hypothetical protein